MPPEGCLSRIAMSSAASTTFVSRLVLIAHPTIRRLQTSSTIAR